MPAAKPGFMSSSCRPDNRPVKKGNGAPVISRRPVSYQEKGGGWLMRKHFWTWVVVVAILVTAAGCWLKWEKFQWSDRKTPVEEMPENEEGGGE